MAVSGRKIADFQGSVSCGSAEDFEHSCDPCLAEGQHVEAPGFCVNCQEFLCKNCMRCHQKTKASKHHKILGKDEMDKYVASIKPAEVCIEKCSIHTDEILKFFCPRHDEIGCNDCMLMDHRSCDLDYIPEKCVGLGDTEEYSEIMRNIEETMKEANTVMKTATFKDKEIDGGHDKVNEEFVKFRKEIIDHLDYLQKRIANDANTRKSTNKQKVQTVLTSCTAFTSDIAKLQTKLQHDKASGQNGQLFIDMKQAKSRLLAQDMEQAQLDLDKISTQLSFDRNKDLKSVLSLQNFGKLTKLSTTATIPTSAIVATPPRASVSAECRENAHVLFRADVAAPTRADTTDSPRANTATQTRKNTSDTERTMTFSSIFHTADINVKSRSNLNSCNITGLAILSSGKMVLVDSNNETLKRVDLEKKTVLEEKELDFTPGGIAALPGDQIAVTFPYNKQIQIMATAGPFSTVRSIGVTGECNGVAYHQDCLYVICQDSATLYVLDRQGNTQKTISLRDTAVSSPKYIEFSKSHKLCYVSGWHTSNHSIMSVTLQGEVTAVYTHQHLQRPAGMLVLDDGSLLVCSNWNHAIHHVSADLKQDQVENIDLGHPTSICYSSDRDQIYFGGEDNDLQVFEILYE